MAKKRMFSKTITNSSRFLMMPHSTQNLYFHLGMNADDDGFCEHFTLMRMTESKPDDLKILQARGFVHVFDDKVLVIVDWKENNYLRPDRYTPSKYLEIYKNEIRDIEIGIPTVYQMVYQMEDQIRLDKSSIDKIRDTPPATPPEPPPVNTLTPKKKKEPPPEIKDLKNKIREYFKKYNPEIYFDGTQEAILDKIVKRFNGSPKRISDLLLLYRDLIRNPRKDFWSKSPFTPRGFWAKIDHIIAEEKAKSISLYEDFDKEG